MTKLSERPDCLHCRHYFVTWENDKPRGCRAYEFKSPEWPSQVVLESSGDDCQLFERTRESRGRTRLVR
jgi:hypothetical protein